MCFQHLLNKYMLCRNCLIGRQEKQAPECTRQEDLDRPAAVNLRLQGSEGSLPGGSIIYGRRCCNFPSWGVCYLGYHNETRDTDFNKMRYRQKYFQGVFFEGERVVIDIIFRV